MFTRGTFVLKKGGGEFVGSPKARVFYFSAPQDFLWGAVLKDLFLKGEKKKGGRVLEILHLFWKFWGAIF